MFENGKFIFLASSNSKKEVKKEIIKQEELQNMVLREENTIFGRMTIAMLFKFKKDKTKN